MNALKKKVFRGTFFFNVFTRFLGVGQFNGELNCPRYEKSFVGGVRILFSIIISV